MLASCPRLPTWNIFPEQAWEPAAHPRALWQARRGSSICIPTSSPAQDISRSLSCLPESSFLAALPSCAAPSTTLVSSTFPWSGWFIFSFFPHFPVAGVPRGYLGQHPPQFPGCGSQQVKPFQSWREGLLYILQQREIHLLLFFLGAQKQDIPFLPVACSLWNIPTDVLLHWVCPSNC